MSKTSKRIPVKEENKHQIKELKGIINKKNKEINRLKSEIKTMQAFVNKTVDFLKDDLKDIPIEKLIRGVDSKESKKQIKESLSIEEVKENKKELVREKWAKWRRDMLK